MEALPAGTGMAFVLIQHLDPTHESMMVELLAGQTSMTVRQAAEGMPLEPEHLYVIPPATYLGVGNGVLHLTPPQARHGARLPFDYFLHSLAQEYGPRAICIVLSGTGGDGSLGLAAVKAKGGHVIAQDPGEAGYDGMPRSAIATGGVDLVLPIARIPEALAGFNRAGQAKEGAHPADSNRDWLPTIIELFRSRTSHDFSLYKEGTLQRRIERRMAMCAIATDDKDRYLEFLRRDTGELDLLAKDMLINVTSFFRDPKVFDLLADTIVPDLIRDHSPDRPLRIWIAGCSTGEETYSLAMLFQEGIAAANSGVRLQVFASDVDADAVASAREGVYPATIEAEVSAERLARFFSKDDRGYRILPALRASVVFTVQDVLADPPFSRLDLVSCRNLLIYLRPEAQARVLSVFHFALREGGILLLGSSEAAGTVAGRFEEISKNARLYRHVGRSRPGEYVFWKGAAGMSRIAARPEPDQAPSRQAALAELCSRMVIETYAPTTILINARNECLYMLGPVDRYLRVAPGLPIHDLLAMAREGVRTKLRSAIQQAGRENARIVLPGGRTTDEGSARSFSIAVQPVASEGEQLMLIAFIDDPQRETRRDLPPAAPGDDPRFADLTQELEATKTELREAIHSLEMSSEEQKAINEEALSVNEEFQSTNEELLTSKEELQSLNEELTALNTQLQETLEQQRTTSNDLQNVLFSADVATLFLDPALNIRFFTPATKALFNVIPGDIGRPLADLNSLASDGGLLADARAVLRTSTPLECEIEARNGAWFTRRVLPYRTHDNGVEGVVITFVDITAIRHAADALEAAKREAQLANIAKSRFLAAASHDLRQPLQTLALLQGQLARTAESDDTRRLVARLDDTLESMSSMLNTLLDINQIEAGTIRSEAADFPIDDMFERLRDEFGFHAQAAGLAFRVVPCGLVIHSDPRLLEQMVRNLLSNALKYTESGKVLLGCRRRKESVSIEIWDTGVGIPDKDLQTIFGEYHQLGRIEPEGSRGLGLGLSIVQRLGDLLGHRVQVRSDPGKGSVFAIVVSLPQGATALRRPRVPAGTDVETVDAALRTGAILVIEDDPQMRELLGLLLEGEGHFMATAADGGAAIDLVARGAVCPDIILADYNLSSGINGLQVSAKLREMLQRHIPVVILTGDISTEVLREIARADCVQLNKPVKMTELSRVVQRLLPVSQAAGPGHAPPRPQPTRDPAARVAFVVDDDREIRDAMRTVLEDVGWAVETFSTSEAFLEAYRPVRESCLLVDAYLPGMSGLELLRRLREEGDRVPTIVITGFGDVPMAVQAMKAGASDFIEKPVGPDELLASIAHALEQALDSARLSAWRSTAANCISALTPRQREIMDLILAGHPNKNIAADLRISQRTVENHRAAIMKKTGAKSVPALARLALAAAWNGSGTADQGRPGAPTTRKSVRH